MTDLTDTVHSTLSDFKLIPPICGMFYQYHFVHL